MLTWNNASVVSYYGPVLSSSEESSAIQQKNEKFCKDPIDTFTTQLPWQMLRPLNPTPSIIANNCRGIPLRLTKAATVAAGHRKDCYAHFQRVSQQNMTF